MSVKLRCAIYTRKSTEEGLEQNFNSLHAQREACEAYVLSQAGEGWTALTAVYDDGGYSGGNIDRPGLQCLLSDIARGEVDIVVVYKVDRLTRSLADFAKMVELFDAKGVSFVSVTQAFNTTSSMGRLTLNVLLSFAQFEREVTGERIRDKVAASKAKGLRMGGQPPLGYDIQDGRLAVNAPEAERVRAIFRRYLEVESSKAMASEGVRAKRWTSLKGVERGGGLMSHGAINYLLRNPTYRGVTRHHEKRYEDTHSAIIDEELWDAVQAKLDQASAARRTRVPKGPRGTLDGKLFDDQGHPMLTVHTNRGAKRYRYYLSRAAASGEGTPGSLKRVPVGLLEGFVLKQLEPALSASWRPDLEGIQRLAEGLSRLAVGEDRIEACFTQAALHPQALERAAPGDDATTAILRVAFEMRRRQGAAVLQAAGAKAEAGVLDRTLIRAVVLARRWAGELERGEVVSIKALAKREALCSHYTTRLLRLAYLAPEITSDILAGRQSVLLTLGALTKQALPLGWGAQRALVNSLG